MPPEEEGGCRENTEGNHCSSDRKREEDSLEKNNAASRIKKESRELVKEDEQVTALSERKLILKELDTLKKQIFELERRLSIKYCDLK